MTKAGLSTILPDKEAEAITTNLKKYLEIEEITENDLLILIKEEKEGTYFHYDMFPDGFFAKYKEGPDYVHPPHTNQEYFILQNPQLEAIVQKVVLTKVAGAGLTIAEKIAKLFQKKS